MASNTQPNAMNGKKQTGLNRVPHKQSLVEQTVSALRREIDEGTWRGWLPAERFLCEHWQVSRNTLRAALRELSRERVICAVHGRGTRILRAHAKQPSLPVSRDVALLIPDPLDQIRPAQALWIDELRGMLSERNCRLHVMHGHQYFKSNPGAALQKLTSQNPHACWVVALSGQAVQQWFERSALPCIVAGTTYRNINLPFCDIDHRALCHHAAGVMLSKGHRRLGMLLGKSQHAGDLQSEEGFKAGVAESPHKDAVVTIGYHESTVISIARALNRMLTQKLPPTALLITNPHHFLTVVSQLKQWGSRIPEDISVISRDDDTFLSFMVPRPARYRADSQKFARMILRPVMDILKTGSVVQRCLRIMPEFVAGDSLRSIAPH